MDQSEMPTVRTGRIICSVLFGGIVLFWAVALLLTGQNLVDQAFPLDASVLIPIALLVGAGGFIAALVYRSKALASIASVSGVSAERSSSESLANLQSNLIIAWALLEGFALLMGAVFIFTALTSLLIITAAVIIPGFALTFPRTEWYG